MKRPKRRKDWPDPKGLVTITNSARTTFLTCRRKYWYSYLELLDTKSRPMYFIVGDIWHNLMELWYGGATKAACLRALTKMGREARVECMELQWKLEDLEKSLVMLKGMFLAYLELYKDDRKKWKILALEENFKRPMVGVKGYYSAGKRDMVVLEDGKQYLVEHKTTGDLNTDYVDRITLDSQIHHYFTYAKKEYPKLAGVIYNVIMKTRIRQKKGETASQFLQRVQDEYKNDPAKYFYRTRVVIPAWSLRDYQKDLVASTKDIIAAKKVGRKAFYKNTGACFNRGACLFAGVCKSNESDDALIHFRRKETAHPELEA